MAEGTAALTTEELLRGLECPVCQEHYRDPRMLQCGHTLCLKPCLEQIVAGKQRFKCPECRNKHDDPPGGINQIPKNVVVSRLDVRPKTSTSEPKIQNCPICGEEDDLRKCGHCQMLICLDCVNEHVPLYREQLKEKISDILQKADGLIQDLSTETGLEIKLRGDFEQILQQISEAEDRSIKLIRSKAAFLRNEVQSTHQKRVANITSGKKTLGGEWVDFASRLREDKKVLCAIDNKLATTKLRKMAERLSNVPLHTAHDLNTISKFEAMDFVTDFDCLQRAVDTCFSLHIYSNKSVHALTKQTGGSTADPPLVNLDILSKNVTKLIHTFKTPPGTVQLSQPQAVAVDDNTGDVIVADTGNHRIVKFDSRGNLIVCFGSRRSGTNQFSGPLDILINDQSQMIVCDKDNKCIKIYNRDGALHSVLGVNRDGSSMFKDPRGIALDSDGNIHVCDWSDSWVQVVTQSGARVCSYVITGGRKPSKIGITKEGRICILSSERFFTNHINILNQQRDPVTSWTVPDTSWVMCVTRDHVLVCDVTTSKIHVYNFRGEEVKVFYGNKVGGCQRPQGLAVDKQGNVYVPCKKFVIKF